MNNEEQTKIVIDELSKILNDLKNGDIFVVPRKYPQFNSDYCALSGEEVISRNGMYTFEMQIFDNRMKELL